MSTPVKTVTVLISGSGTNLQALIDASASGRLCANITKVISDKPMAYGLERARDAGIRTTVIEPLQGQSRESYDSKLAKTILADQPDLVVLAGFMRILSDEIVQTFSGRMLNIHPSLLPVYRGLHTHERVLEAGESTHGCSIHFVSEVLDGGPVIAQAVIRVRSGDTVESLSARVQAAEHKLYPLVVRWFAIGRLRMQDKIPWLDGRPLHTPIRFAPDQEIQDPE